MVYISHSMVRVHPVLHCEVQIAYWQNLHQSWMHFPLGTRKYNDIYYQSVE